MGGGRRYLVMHGSSCDKKYELISVSDDPVSMSMEVGTPPIYP